MTEKKQICFPISLWQWTSLLFVSLDTAWAVFLICSVLLSFVLLFLPLCLCCFGCVFVNVYILILLFWSSLFHSLFFLLTVFTFWFFLTLLSFLFVLSAAPCLWLTGTAGSQSERSQSGAGGQHPAREWCTEDKPSSTRTGNKPGHHLQQGHLQNALTLLLAGEPNI